MAGALGRDVLFTRVAPATYALQVRRLQQALLWHKGRCLLTQDLRLCCAACLMAEPFQLPGCVLVG